MQFFERSKSDSESFEKWIVNHPGGYVLAIRGNQQMLHLGSCGHFKFQPGDKITFGPKVVCLNREKINEWAKKQIDKRYLICRSCRP